MEIEKNDDKMREVYRHIEKELDKVNYDSLWPGFSRLEFAIYNETKVYFKDNEIIYNERFLGNTSINYNGRDLAIFYIKDPDKVSTQELTSQIVHEMFHSYQKSNGEIRFPNDLKGLDYPMVLENYKIKHRENKLIVKALDTKDRDEKLAVLKEFIRLRNIRLSKYGDIIKYELAIETFEGSAEFCGTKALKYICEEAYRKKLEDYKDILLNDKELLFNIRKISYYVGALFLFLVKELELSFIQEIGQNQYIFEEISDKFSYDIDNYHIDNIEDIHENSLEKYFDQYVEDMKKRFQDFYANDIKIVKGNFIIYRYDPMNMIKQDDEILCESFIMLMDSYTGKNLFLKGPLVIKLKEGKYNQVLEYIWVNVK